MAAIVKAQMKVSVQDATTVTLVPTDIESQSQSRDTASPITQIVITMGARDTVVFDIVGRVFDIEIERR